MDDRGERLLRILTIFALAASAIQSLQQVHSRVPVPVPTPIITRNLLFPHQSSFTQLKATPSEWPPEIIERIQRPSSLTRSHSDSDEQRRFPPAPPPQLTLFGHFDQNTARLWGGCAVMVLASRFAQSANPNAHPVAAANLNPAADAAVAENVNVAANIGQAADGAVAANADPAAVGAVAANPNLADVGVANPVPADEVAVAANPNPALAADGLMADHLAYAAAIDVMQVRFMLLAFWAESQGIFAMDNQHQLLVLLLMFLAASAPRDPH